MNYAGGRGWRWVTGRQRKAKPFSPSPPPTHPPSRSIHSAASFSAISNFAIAHSGGDGSRRARHFTEKESAGGCMLSTRRSHHLRGAK